MSRLRISTNAKTTKWSPYVLFCPYLPDIFLNFLWNIISFRYKNWIICQHPLLFTIIQLIRTLVLVDFICWTAAALSRCALKNVFSPKHCSWSLMAWHKELPSVGVLPLIQSQTVFAGAVIMLIMSWCERWWIMASLARFSQLRSCNHSLFWKRWLVNWNIPVKVTKMCCRSEMSGYWPSCLSCLCEMMDLSLVIEWLKLDLQTQKNIL